MPYQLPDELPGGSSNAEQEDVGLFTSALAGVATGLWNIPKGFVSLGAEVFDLVGNTNTATAVEKWFDDVNPFDDEAEARTIGKITQAIAQVAPLGVYGYVQGAKYGSKVARDLAKRAVIAKRNNQSFSMLNFGRKISKTGFGVVGGGIGEAIVADEDIGTLADMLKGTSLEGAALTMMDRETKEGRSEAYRKLLNRIKFGTEGALFNLGLIGAGKGIQKLRTPSERSLTAYSDSPIVRALQKYVVYGLKPEGVGTKTIFELGQQAKSEVDAFKFNAIEQGRDLTKQMENIFPKLEENFFATKGKKMTDVEKQSLQEEYLKNINEVLTTKPTDETSLLTDSAKRILIDY